MPQAMRCRMEIVMKDGTTHAALVDYHKGHWKNPMTDDQLEGKFRKLAASVLNTGQIDRLVDALWRLEALPDAGDVVRLTSAGVR
jgi:2-methylcitrate dehydratase